MRAIDAERRTVMAQMAASAALLCLGRHAVAEDRAGGKSLGGSRNKSLGAQPARWYRAAPGKRVDCELCPRGCRVSDGSRGHCGVRENRGGKYYTLVWGRPCAIHLDPIEKKPFYHVLPGRTALSLATVGCNLECSFCQNWEISQASPEDVPASDAPPARIVQLAKEQGAPTIACTYTEPVVWAEYVYDIAVAGNQAGLKTLMVSNGFIQARPMSDLIGVLSAVKIDLKSYTDTFYRKQCRAELGPVLDTLRLLARRKIWTEIVVLVIPGLNDSDQEAHALARFVRDEVGRSVPVHFTRFHPSYRLTNVPSTPVRTLERVREAALSEGLEFVYVGNVLGHPGNHTYCPGCHKVLIQRTGMAVTKNRLVDGKCPDCQRPIAGIWR